MSSKFRGFDGRLRMNESVLSAYLFLTYFLLLCVALYLLNHFVLRYNLYPSIMDQCRIFVINLDSCKDRLDYMEKLMNGKHLTFERIEAVDGNDLNFYDFDTGELLKLEEVSKDGLIVARKMYVGHNMGEKHELIFDYDFRKSYKPDYRYKMSIGELGCCYSHRIAWKKVVAEDLPYAVVLEDDITLYEDFSERLQEVLKLIPPEADFISINQRVRGDKSLKTSEAQFLRLCSSGTTRVMCTGMYAYIITNQGARKLLEFTRNTSAPIDIEVPMAHMSKKINQYVTVKRMLNHNYNLESVLTRMGRKGWDEEQNERTKALKHNELTKKSKIVTRPRLGKSAKVDHKVQQDLDKKVEEKTLEIESSRMTDKLTRRARILKWRMDEVRAAVKKASSK